MRLKTPPSPNRTDRLFSSCPRCRGALFHEPGASRCRLCGRIFYHPGAVVAQMEFERVSGLVGGPRDHESDRVPALRKGFIRVGEGDGSS